MYYGLKTVNKRIAELRDILGLSQSEFAEKLGITEKKGRSTVNNWETGGIQVKSDDLILISETFNVSTDWLLGRESNPSAVETISSASEFTGLSYEAIELLHLAAVSEEAESKRTLRFLNMVLADPDNNAKKNVEEGLPVDTVFSLMDRFVHSKSAMLSERYGENEQFRKYVTMDLDDESFMLTAPELLRQFLMNEIQKSLERYQEQASKEKNRGKQ